MAFADHVRTGESTVGLLDKFKEKAAEVAENAKDHVSEATGFDVDRALDAAGTAIEGVDSVTEAVDSFGETKDRLTGN